MAHLDQEVNNETKTNGAEDLFSVDSPVMGMQEKAMKTTIKVARVECGSQVDETSQVEREVTYSPDEVTVVESSDNVLYTKKLVYEDGKLVNKVSAPHAVWHKASNRSVATYEDLNGLLLELSEIKTACVIRGQVFDCYQGTKVRRTHRGGWKRPSHSVVKEAQTAYFAGVPRRWLCVDIDGDDSKGMDCFVYAPVPSGTPAEVAHFMAHWLVNTWLPEPFRGRRAVVQFSSSFWASGVSSKVKAHIWFLLDEAVDPGAIQDVMWQAYSNVLAGDGKPFRMGAEEGQRRLDGCTARISHPNFTASPLVVEDGVVVPDKHRDYRVIEVNKAGSRVQTATLLADLDAAKDQKLAASLAAPGGIAFTKAKAEHKSDATAQGDILSWDAKTHADYKLAQEALAFLGASYYDFYEPWLVVGMCIHYRFSGKEGLDLWTTWSKQSAHYTESEAEDSCETKWGTFTTNVENPRTLGKLFGMASDHGFVLPKKATKAAGKGDGPGAAQHDDEDAPELPTFLGELEVEPKSKAAYRLQVSKALALLLRDAELCKLAVAHFEHAGEARLLDFLGTLATFGAVKAVVSQMAKKLTPRKAVELTLPTVDGHPIEMTEVPGFVVSNAGVYRETFSDVGERSLTKVLSQPLFILSEDTPLGVGHGDVVKLTLTWHKDCRWSTHRISAPDIAEKSKVVAVLSALGLEITSTVAVGVVDYIQAYRESNRVFIDKRTYTSRMGWQIRDGEVLGYTLGQMWIPFVGNDHGVEYQPEDGAQSDATNFSAKAGSLEGWSEMASRLQEHPIAAAMLYASACAPLLHVVGSPGFTLDLGGKTSTGKTTAMRVAASVWGSPIDGDPHRVFSNWKTTGNAVEARCARTNDLPLMLDDTKEASSPHLTSEVVYMITNGQAKARATQTGGLRAGMTFRKVLISTGENLILDNNEHGGVRARVLSLTGLPLGAKSQEAGILARSLTTDASTHYGHAGEALVRALCDGTLSWSDLRTEYTGLKQALEATTGDEGITARLAAYVALLQLAGRLLVNLCGVDLPVDDHIASIWALCTKAATESDPVANALNTIWGYQDSNRNRLVGAVEVPPHGTVPHGGWLGKCAVLDGKPVVYVVVDEAKRVLTSAGHNFAALCRSWVEEGILAPDPDGKSARVTRIGGGSQRCLCFWQGKVEEALGGVPDENDSPY